MASKAKRGPVPLGLPAPVPERGARYGSERKAERHRAVTRQKCPAKLHALRAVCIEAGQAAGEKREDEPRNTQRAFFHECPQSGPHNQIAAICRAYPSRVRNCHYVFVPEIRRKCAPYCPGAPRTAPLLAPQGAIEVDRKPSIYRNLGPFGVGQRGALPANPPLGIHRVSNKWLTR